MGPSVQPEHGITGYAGDPTQVNIICYVIAITELYSSKGPACAIAAGPATVFRNYFAPTGPQLRSGQTHDNQINNLDEFQILLMDDRTASNAPDENRLNSGSKSDSGHGEALQRTDSNDKKVVGKDYFFNVRNGYTFSSGLFI